MAMVVTRVGQSHDGKSGLSCSALSVRLGGVSLELPTLSATGADYDHASSARMALDADVFNYYHRHSMGYPITHRGTQDNIGARVREAQKRHGPRLTLVSLEHPGDLTDAGLAAFHALQVRLGLRVITTVEKNPMQGLGGLREELEAFDGLDTDQERFPTISVRCDPRDFREKLLHIVDRYGGFNLQWGGHGEFSTRWRILADTLRANDVWCNVVGILNRESEISMAGQKIRVSGAARALLYGGHSYCFAWPHYHPPATAGGGASQGGASQGGARGPGGRDGAATLFNPETWLYGPCGLDYHVARTRSFNAIQGALGLAREEILGGTFYSLHCAQRPGLGGALAQVSGLP